MINKTAHYRSFYEVAKKIKDPEARLAFYDAVDAYRFDGVEPENLPEMADLAFTAIRANIDADLNRKQGGAPSGNNNAKKAEAAEEAPKAPAEKEAAPAKDKRFKRPALDEVKAYCRERSNRVDPVKFFNYYEANGWKVGRNPMKDWKAAVRNWERTESGNGQQLREDHDPDKLAEYYKSAEITDDEEMEF